MHRFKRILYSFGGRPLDDPGVERAVRIAAENDATLTLAAVLPPAEVLAGAGSELGLGDLGDAVRGDRSRSLEALGSFLRADVRVRTRVLEGDPVDTVVEEVRRGQHDLLMAGAGGARSFRSQVFGGVERRLMRTCPCPVWLLDPTLPGRLGTVLAAVDVSADGPPGPLTLDVLQLASSLAEREGGRLHLVHAVDLFGDSILRSPTRGVSRRRLATVRRRAREERRERLEALLTTALFRPGGLHDLEGPTRPGHGPAGDTAWETQVGIHVTRGVPAEVIAETARRVGADVLVMGHRGRGGLPGLLIGNVAEQVLDRLRCGVLTVPPERRTRLEDGASPSDDRDASTRTAQEDGHERSSIPEVPGP